jgi:hypothetical protein
MLVLLMQRNHEVHSEMSSGGMIFSYIPSFIKSDTSVGGILWFRFNNLKGCNVGITTRYDL